VRLSLANLGGIGRQAAVPNYRRSSLRPGIVHFGVGNFHRAHQAVYLDELFNKGRGCDWAVVGAGVMAADEVVRKKLAHQDYLTTVVEQDAERSAARVIGSMVDFIPGGDRAQLLSRLADPAIRIVSLTITEGGYFINPATGQFDPANPAILRDAGSPDEPATVFGLILAGLARRRSAGTAPFTVMSCDNVPHNGDVTRNAVVGLASLSDPALGRWVEDSVAFPNGMVDRITPATTDRQRRILAETFGIDDEWPVFCEEFRQWVLEDRFCSGRPALELAGVDFVNDVSPYEQMKIRILNGGHATIAYPAGLLGVHYVHDAMADDLLRSFLARIELQEIVPTVPPVPNTDLRDYFRLIERRFANPKIGDTVGRLCFDGSNRQPKFIVPSIHDRLKAKAGVGGLALVSALWCRYCYGTTDQGATIEPNDPNWDRLRDTAWQARDNPAAWIAMADIYGDAGKAPEFAAAFTRALASLWANGVEKTLRDYLDARP
jgi:mannitol 2-dehydrogenase